jgi:hypothetical protein
VEEALKAAAQPQVEGSGEEYALASRRQSRHLQSLAAAAQRFHRVASSTASSRNSFAWGSEAGDLTYAQRERIELWNDLQTVEESPYDESTSDQTPIHLRGPSRAANSSPPEPRKVTGASRGIAAVENDGGGGDDDDTDLSDGSDLESDMLNNFEALASASFSSRDYSKAEQVLRMAVERSMGDRSDLVVKSLKLKLALCCCLQGKWDHAAGTMSSLPKTRTLADLPIFHLLQAISLGHLEGNRYDFAYDVCKSALSGKKKILGRTSADYYGCLAVFAAICEKRGNALEAEAVRHSIPESWLRQSGLVVLSSTQYLLQHETLVSSIFPGTTTGGSGPLSTRPRSPALPGVVRTGTASGHRPTSPPGIQRDGVQGSQKDEGGEAVVAKATDASEKSLSDSVASPPQPVSPQSMPTLSNSDAQRQQKTQHLPIQVRPDVLERPARVTDRPARVMDRLARVIDRPARVDGPNRLARYALDGQTQARFDALLSRVPQGPLSTQQPRVGIQIQRPSAPGPERDRSRSRPDGEISGIYQGVTKETDGAHQRALEHGLSLRARPRSRAREEEAPGLPGGPLRLSVVSPAPRNPPWTAGNMRKDVSHFPRTRMAGATGPPRIVFTNSALAAAAESWSIGVALRSGSSDAIAIGNPGEPDTVRQVPCAPVCAERWQWNAR